MSEIVINIKKGESEPVRGEKARTVTDRAKPPRPPATRPEAKLPFHATAGRIVARVSKSW